jgi:hypothetical protein
VTNREGKMKFREEFKKQTNKITKNANRRFTLQLGFMAARTVKEGARNFLTTKHYFKRFHHIVASYCNHFEPA